MAAADYFFRPADIVLLAKYDRYMIKHISVGREPFFFFFCMGSIIIMVRDGREHRLECNGHVIIITSGTWVIVR